MRKWFLIVALVLISFDVVAQEKRPKPEISEAPLTSEQITVYRAVLEGYLKRSNRALKLANVTEPIDGANSECLRGLNARVAKEPASIVHRIAASTVADTKIVLVDSERQQSTIKENDPQKLIRQAVDDHQAIPDVQLDKAVETAMDSGLFTLSEIAFDRKHLRAVVSYSFVCGGLCGNGNTLVLRKVRRKWKVAKRCGGWVS